MLYQITNRISVIDPHPELLEFVTTEMRGEWNDEPVLYHEWDGSTLTIPRGLRFWFEEWIELMEFDYSPWVNTKWEVSLPRNHKIQLRYYQRPAVDAILREENGVVQIPAGGGKTVVAIAAFCESQAKRGIVLVDKIELANQWVERFEEFAPEASVSIYGGGNLYDPSADVTIALLQTVRSRHPQPLDPFFEEFSFLAHDEAHHSTADSYFDVLNRFTARYRIAISATPGKTGDPNLVLCTFGKVIYEVTSQELYDAQALLQAEVFVVNTPFEFAYVGDGEILKSEACPIKCRKEGTTHSHRNNYQKLKKALIAHAGRNARIAREVINNSGSKQLLVSDRLEHFDAIEQKLLELGFEDPILRLTGQQTKKQRAQVSQQMQEDLPYLTFSTVADEGLDVASLEVIHLASPASNLGGFVQKIGRVERFRANKFPKVYHYVDKRVRMLLNQYSKVKSEVYRRNGYVITQI